MAGVAAYALKRIDARPGPVTLPKSERSLRLRLDTAYTGLQSPVHLISPAGDERVFIVEQNGRIRVGRGGRLSPRIWLDISERVGSGGERGLLSLAFHPQFASTGRFFVYYTDRRGDLLISAFRADPAGEAADPTSEQNLLTVRHPVFGNHNGGHVLFGPDGALYAGTGDGGSAGDPRGNAQSRESQLGKLLRIDISGAVPRVTQWAFGLRNPWRMAFDEGRLFIADVGQGAWEEINVVAAGDSALNYGWRILEGAHCFINPVCAKDGTVLPAVEYHHDEGCSVTGGAVYRGRAVPDLAGHYFYSDYCSGWLRSFRYEHGAARDHRRWAVPRLGSISSFGTDAAGELYVIAHEGTIYRIAGL